MLLSDRTSAAARGNRQPYSLSSGAARAHTHRGGDGTVHPAGGLVIRDLLHTLHM